MDLDFNLKNFIRFMVCTTVSARNTKPILPWIAPAGECKCEPIQ